jgi:putative tricarboxylic transport membrane protein
MKKTMFMLTVTLVFLGALIVGFAPVVNAEYPDKPLEFVAHSTPGGGTDIFIRAMAQILESKGIVKEKIRVANRSGGGCTTALDYLASKKGSPDVIMTISTSCLDSMMRGSTKMKYEDITLITALVEDVTYLFASGDAPYNDMKELVAWAKKTNTELNVAIGSTGGSEHISAHRLKKVVGVPWNIISFKGGAGGAVALLGGHADLKVGNINEVCGQGEAKKGKILGVLTEKRIPMFPDVPTMKEQGFNAVYRQIRGFWAPQNFPAYALKFWEDAFDKVRKTKEFGDYVKSIDGVKLDMKGKAFKNFLDQYVAELSQDFKELDIYQKK